MNSDTLIGSSPISAKRAKVSNNNDTNNNINIISKNDRKCQIISSLEHRISTNQELFRCEVRNTLNPYLNLNNIIFAVPMEWYNFLSGYIRLPTPAIIKYLEIRKELEPIIFPKLNKNKKIINVQLHDINDNRIAFAIWFNFYDINNYFQNNNNCNHKLIYIRSLIFDYLTKMKITTIPFMMILSTATLSMDKIRKVYNKIQLKMEERNINHKKLQIPNKPLFTLHLQDEDNPFLLLWMDTENICSFNISRLDSPKTRANFVNSLMVFISFTISNQRDHNDNDNKNDNGKSKL
ncbi:hypothetical protein DAPK24_045320 [Pichia kluyveri]|uniref:Uncharacterized protein n=1 Tax=Pichia kluyveri TaxID=36015 RepID=A0AAV5R8P6_PICKL|nr:hypothetical protein DAPK24_045320 [Pichia kluyveri]